MEIVRSWCCVVFHRMKAPVCICFPGSSAGKESTCQCRRLKRYVFDTWVWEDFLEKPTLVFLPGESHRQRSTEGCSPWSRKELDMIEATWHAHIVEFQCYLNFCYIVTHYTHTHTHTHILFPIIFLYGLLSQFSCSVV